tara:strand:+ start:196 stop:648 length:453 start_codon:yes stop_codon:yes gene_type:complete
MENSSERVFLNLGIKLMIVFMILLYIIGFFIFFKANSAPKEYLVLLFLCLNVVLPILTIIVLCNKMLVDKVKTASKYVISFVASLGIYNIISYFLIHLNFVFMDSINIFEYNEGASFLVLGFLIVGNITAIIYTSIYLTIIHFKNKNLPS